jgi:hypothetical protein
MRHLNVGICRPKIVPPTTGEAFIIGRKKKVERLLDSLHTRISRDITYCEKIQHSTDDRQKRAYQVAFRNKEELKELYEHFCDYVETSIAVIVLLEERLKTSVPQEDVSDFQKQSYQNESEYFDMYARAIAERDELKSRLLDAGLHNEKRIA